MKKFYELLSTGFYGHYFNLGIRTSWSNELYELTENRNVDVAIVSEQYTYKNIKVKIFEESIYLVKLKNPTLDNKKYFHPSELNVEDEIFFSWSKKIDLWHNYWWPSTRSAYISLDTPSKRECYLLEHRYPKPSQVTSINLFKTFLREYIATS